ncbi:MAG TPA: DNA adenine methylase [Desulfobulbaceae bacterium]|nr:DNA adenine methylase [Desulfobulbaceae bacterium]
MRDIFVPPIKCQGIKSKLVPWIKTIIPTDFAGVWVEPFLGSGVVAFNVRPRRALLTDSNPHLINFYQAVAGGRITADIAKAYLKKEGDELLRSEGEHYYLIRERFNRHGDPLDFLFLNRAGFNGMIRFNRRGEFNIPFCRKPNRFAPAYITKIGNQIQAVADVCAWRGYEFRCQDYAQTIAEAGTGDLIYCDPPYIGRHTDYFNAWDEGQESRLGKLLAATEAKFILSTWHSNEFRSNQFISSTWKGYHIMTREHFYHVGAKEENRNPVLEALVTNFAAADEEKKSAKPSRLTLFEKYPAHGKSEPTALR